MFPFINSGQTQQLHVWHWLWLLPMTRFVLGNGYRRVLLITPGKSLRLPTVTPMAWPGRCHPLQRSCLRQKLLQQQRPSTPSELCQHSAIGHHAVFNLEAGGMATLMNLITHLKSLYIIYNYEYLTCSHLTLLGQQWRTDLKTHAFLQARPAGDNLIMYTHNRSS